MPSDFVLSEPPGGWAAPWPQARELATAVTEGWVLVGGLMVDVHARIAGVASRATVDVDALLDVALLRLPDIDETLRRLGYDFHASIDEKAPAHRWVRETDGAVIDILVPDHMPRPPRFRQRGTMAAPGGTAVLTRHLTAVRISGTDEDVRIAVPTVAGAIVLKARAYLVDSRDRERHLDDLGVLISTLDDYRPVVAAMSPSDRRHVRAVLRPLHVHLGKAGAGEARRLLPYIAVELRLDPPLEAAKPSPFRPGRK